MNILKQRRVAAFRGDIFACWLCWLFDCTVGWVLVYVIARLDPTSARRTALNTRWVVELHSENSPAWYIESVLATARRLDQLADETDQQNEQTTIKTRSKSVMLKRNN